MVYFCFLPNNNQISLKWVVFWNLTIPAWTGRRPPKKNPGKPMEHRNAGIVPRQICCGAQMFVSPGKMLWISAFRSSQPFCSYLGRFRLELFSLRCLSRTVHLDYLWFLATSCGISPLHTYCAVSMWQFIQLASFAVFLCKTIFTLSGFETTFSSNFDACFLPFFFQTPSGQGRCGLCMQLFWSRADVKAGAWIFWTSIILIAAIDADADSL